MEQKPPCFTNKITQRGNPPPQVKKHKNGVRFNPLRSEEAQETRTLCIHFHLKRLSSRVFTVKPGKMGSWGCNPMGNPIKIRPFIGTPCHSIYNLAQVEFGRSAPVSGVNNW